MADALLSRWVLLFGAPRRLLTDQRANVESPIVQNLCTIWRIEKVRTMAYYPPSEGACESRNQTSKRGLQKSLNERRLDEYDVVLSDVMFAYNSTVNSSTGFTPSFLIFGVEARIPSEILVGLPEMERRPAGYALHRYQKLGVASEAPRESAYTPAKRAKDYYDIGAIQKQFQVRDNVRIRMAPLNRPLQNCIQNGPNSNKSGHLREYLPRWRTLGRISPLAFT